jgi:hypothetical protein
MPFKATLCVQQSPLAMDELPLATQGVALMLNASLKEVNLAMEMAYGVLELARFVEDVAQKV